MQQQNVRSRELCWVYGSTSAKHPLPEARDPAETAKWNKIYAIKHMQIHIIISDSFWRNWNVFYIFCKYAGDAHGKFFQKLLRIESETQENKPINQVEASVQYWHICCFHKKYISTTQSANLFWQMLWSCQIWGGGGDPANCKAKWYN